MKTCRYCKKPVDTPIEQKNITWYQRSHGWYYHLDCWKKLQNTKNDKTNEDWLDLIFDVLTRELKSKYNYHMIVRQCQNMVSDGRTMKGIYYTVKYAFCVKNVKYEPKYGLGLIPHLYEESAQYWKQRWVNEMDIFDKIEKLQRERKSDKHILQMQPKKKTVTAEPKI